MKKAITLLCLALFSMSLASTSALATVCISIPDGEDSEDAVIEEAEFTVDVRRLGVLVATHRFTLELKKTGANWVINRTVSTTMTSYNGFTATITSLSRTYNNTTKRLEYSAQFSVILPGGGTETPLVTENIYLGW